MDRRPDGEYPPVQEQPSAPPPYSVGDGMPPGNSRFPSNQIHDNTYPSGMTSSSPRCCCCCVGDYLCFNNCCLAFQSCCAACDCCRLGCSICLCCTDVNCDCPDCDCSCITGCCDCLGNGSDSICQILCCLCTLCPQ